MTAPGAGWSTEEIVAWVLAAHARDDNVVGLGFGPASVAGGMTDTPAAVVIVRRKRPPEAVAAAQRLPVHLRGLRCDVIDGSLGARPVVPVGATARARRGGGRLAGPRRPWGTLGCVVRDAVDGARLVVSNAHVLVPHGRLVPPWGTGPCAAVAASEVLLGHDDHLLAPGRRPVGPVARWVPLAPVGRGYNLLDAATAWAADDILDGVAGVGPVRPWRGLPSWDAPLVKVGAGSEGLGSGALRLTRAAVVVRSGDYGPAGAGDRWVFAEQLVVAVDQAGGDSGAVLLDADGAAVGLLHARLGAGLALAAPAPVVEASLGVRFGDPGA